MDCLTSALGICPVCMSDHSGSNKQAEKPKKVTSIAEVNGKVIVTLDDGQYLTAEMSAVDRNLGSELNANIDEKLSAMGEKLEEKADKSIILGLESRVEALETKNQELEQLVNELITMKTTLAAGLVEVQTLAGTGSFKAFNLDTIL